VRDLSVVDPQLDALELVAPDRPRRAPVRRRVVRTAIAVLAVLALVFGGAGWYVSGQILDALRIAPPADVEHDTEVVALADGEITLERPDETDLAADRDAVMGLSWEGGYGRIGPAVSADGGLEVRPFTLIDGEPPEPGRDRVDVDSYAFPPDPERAGIPVEVVTYPGPDGDLEAWYVPGDHPTWIVAVHGAGAGRHEFLRLVEATRELGHPLLLVTYRNDPGAPSSDGSLVLNGQEEWPDVAAAVDHAVESGASDVVVYGASMGTGLSLAYALEADAAPVRALVLESPNVDLREIVRLRSGEALPVGGAVGDAILAVGRAVTSLRSGLDFDAVDYVDRADELDVPVLVFHGALDPKIPTEVPTAFAEARPDLVEFHLLETGAHVRAWNEGPEAYAATVRDFLGRVTDAS
jgi:uncharacterized protein